MSSFIVLFKGELLRMKKYNILSASLVVALIWIVTLHLTGIENLSMLFLLIIFVDATSMAILLIGATMFFEKQEGALKTLLVSPMGKAEYILSKSCAGIFTNLLTLFILYLYAKLFKEININLALLLGGTILAAFFHSMVGFVVTYNSRDFTELLMGMFRYILVLMTPVLLDQLGVISSRVVKNMFYILPTKATYSILSAAGGGLKAWEVCVSIAYLAAGSALLYYVALKKFDDFAAKESGV